MERVVRIRHSVTRKDDAVTEGNGGKVGRRRAKVIPRWIKATLKLAKCGLARTLASPRALLGE